MSVCVRGVFLTGLKHHLCVTLIIAFFTIKQCLTHAKSPRPDDKEIDSNEISPKTEAKNADTEKIIIMFCVTFSLLFAAILIFFVVCLCRHYHKRNGQHRRSRGTQPQVRAIYDPSYFQFDHGHPYVQNAVPYPFFREDPRREATQNSSLPVQGVDAAEITRALHMLLQSSRQNLPAERRQHDDQRHGLPEMEENRSTDFMDSGLGSSQRTETSGDDPDEGPLDVKTLGLFQQFDDLIRDLFVPTERSIMKTVADKLVVAITHEVGEKGDLLILDNVGISLYVPPGAVNRGDRQLFTLVLNWDLTDNPDMDRSQSLVSPVVFCGPHGLKLNKQCVLRYKHCAYDPRDIDIMVSETDLLSLKKWELMCNAQEEENKCLISQEECQIHLNHFSLVTSIQTPRATPIGKKWLQVAVFSSPLRPDIDHYQVRVYFLNKTLCALQWAIQNEATFGGKISCPEKVFLFNGKGEDMFLRLSYLSTGWQAIDGSEEDRIPFLNIWHGKCPYASMCFKRENHVPTNGRDEISIHFLVHQDTHDNEAERLFVHMTGDKKRQLDQPSPYCSKHNKDAGFGSVQIRLPGPTSPVVRFTRCPEDKIEVDLQNQRMNLEDIKEALSFKQTIPERLKQQLVLVIDPRCPFGNDWRGLASRLGLDRCIPYLETKQSPTELILHDMENKGKTLSDLHLILKDMGREDAASLVQTYIGTMPKRVAVEMDSG